MDALAYGCTRYALPGLRAAWGARLIINMNGQVDFVPDRQDMQGEPELVAELQAWLEGPPRYRSEETVLAALRATVRTRLIDGLMSTREDGGQWLYDDDKGVILGNPQASYGYLYVLGWTFSALPDGCETKGADLLVEEFEKRT